MKKISKNICLRWKTLTYLRSIVNLSTIKSKRGISQDFRCQATFKFNWLKYVVNGSLYNFLELLTWKFLYPLMLVSLSTIWYVWTHVMTFAFVFAEMLPLCFFFFYQEYINVLHTFVIYWIFADIKIPSLYICKTI